MEAEILYIPEDRKVAAPMIIAIETYAMSVEEYCELLNKEGGIYKKEFARGGRGEYIPMKEIRKFRIERRKQ